MKTVVVALLISRAAYAAPPSGYQCVPGTVKKDVGCTCPAGYAEKRDGENIATCVAVAAAPNYTALFVKALDAGDLANAIELAQKLDGAVDSKATEALSKSYATWLAKAKTDAASYAKAGRCGAIEAFQSVGGQYSLIWENLLAKLEKRSPALQSTASKKAQISQAIELLLKQVDPCIEVASKTNGTDKLTEMFAAARAGNALLSQCLKRPTDSHRIKVRVVVDADGRMMRKTLSVHPSRPSKAGDPQSCVAEFFNPRKEWPKVGTTGYAATLEVSAGPAESTKPKTDEPPPEAPKSRPEPPPPAPVTYTAVEPPSPIGETPIERSGHVWSSGYWNWKGGQWVWTPGQWLPVRAGQTYRSPRWEKRDKRWALIPGDWIPK
jgi:hypothetical protein